MGICNCTDALFYAILILKNLKYQITNFKLLSVLLFLTASSYITEIRAQNWPNWRGPNGDGTSTEINLPARWDSITNIVWKSKIPGIGHSSPVIWEDKLFTLTALTETQEKVLLCYNAQTGGLLWQETVVKSDLEGKHNDNSYASGTPATDGKLVYVSFLDGQDVVVAAYDFTGKQIWIQRPGKFSSPHGYSCSPALFENKQMIFLGNKEVASYNPDDGSRIWYVNGPSEDFCSSPVYNENSGLVLVSSFTTMTNGQVNCIEVATGNILWTENPGKTIFFPGVGKWPGLYAE